MRTLPQTPTHEKGPGSLLHFEKHGALVLDCALPYSLLENSKLKETKAFKQINKEIFNINQISSNNSPSSMSCSSSSFIRASSSFICAFFEYKNAAFLEILQSDYNF